MDLSYLCLNISRLMGLPVRLYQKEVLVENHHPLHFEPDPVELVRDEFSQNPQTVAYSDTVKPLFFGSIYIPSKKSRINIGPTFSVKPSAVEVHFLMRSLGISQDQFSAFSEYLGTIPTYSIETFLQILCFINYSVSGEKKSAVDLLVSPHDTEPTHQIPEPVSVDTDDIKIHNTYQMENQLLSHIALGQVDSLLQMFQTPPVGRAGKIAHDNLRQIKNAFICSATLASRAAITGGVPQEIAFSLSDFYSQKVELLSEYHTIAKLNMDMLLDFATRVANINIPGVHSKILTEIVRYICTHTSTKLSIDSLAKEFTISRTMLCRLFADELNTTASTFITQQKIAEAKRLLIDTTRSLSDISNYLCFSSQSYFQNVFKKSVGMTPTQFRLN